LEANLSRLVSETLCSKETIAQFTFSGTLTSTRSLADSFE
jgi:hypothetical protein